MDRHTDAQTVNLVGLELGQFMTVVITDATDGGNCVLEFKNGSDPDWTVDPSFNGEVSESGLLIQRVKCLSAQSRIRFATDPVGHPYYINLVWEVLPSY